MSYYDCLDGPAGCKGEVIEYYALSGSGERYPRCEKHYEEYYDRVQPKMEEIERRYPRFAPDDFDPAYAGERWDEDY